MNTREAVGDILIILAAAFTAYLSVIMIRRIRSVVLKDPCAKLFRYELAACAVFILLALDIRFGLLTGMKPAALKAAGWCVRSAAALAAAALLSFAARIMIVSFIKSAVPARYAIVLGLALENGKPAGDLVSRLDTAEKYLRENPDATLILTGGNPGESGKTEAAVMRDILAERGIGEDKMILEDQSESTKENFRNVAGLINPGETVVLISSNYHMDRAAQTAKSAGFSDVRLLPAPSSFINFGANIMCEAVLELNERTFKR